MRKTSTRKIMALGIVGLLCATQQLKAQSETPADGKDIIKMNVGALLLKSYSFQYERAVGEKISVAIGYRNMPKSNIPFKKTLVDAVDDDQTANTINTFKTSNFAITPEVRFYLGKKGVFQGFYVAPFVQFAKYNGEGPFDYDIPQLNTTESMFFKGSVNTVSGGVMIGAQWKLSRKFYFDWWIAGPSYGHASGDLTAQKTLNVLEQAELRKQIANFVDDLPIIKATSTVDGNGANINIKGPWAGLRAGLSIGYNF